MLSILHNPPSHLRYNAIPVTQRSLIHVIRLLTRDVSLAPSAASRLSYTLYPTTFAFQKLWCFFRVLDPFRKRDYFASFSICSFDDADRGKFKRFSIRIAREGCEGGSRAVRVESFDERIGGQGSPLDGGKVGYIWGKSYSDCVGGFNLNRSRVSNCWSDRLGHFQSCSRGVEELGQKWRVMTG